VSAHPSVSITSARRADAEISSPVTASHEVLALGSAQPHPGSSVDHQRHLRIGHFSQRSQSSLYSQGQPRIRANGSAPSPVHHTTVPSTNKRFTKRLRALRGQPFREVRLHQRFEWFRHWHACARLCRGSNAARQGRRPGETQWRMRHRVTSLNVRSDDLALQAASKEVDVHIHRPTTTRLVFGAVLRGPAIWTAIQWCSIRGAHRALHDRRLDLQSGHAQGTCQTRPGRG